MVGRLQVVLLSILPTGAALVYLFWMYGWKKTKGTRGRHCQKTQLVEVSRADCDCEWSHDKVDNTAVSCGEEVLLSVHSEQDISAENDVSSGMSVSADVSASPTSNCTDLESTCGDELISATVVTCTQSSELAVDVGSSSTSLDDNIAAKANNCHSVDVSLSTETNDIANEDEELKYPAVDSQEISAVTFLGDENCCNSCITNGNVDIDKVNSDSGCVTNDVASSGCENGRRDSIESVRTFLSLTFSVLVTV